jgi:hypothetical protein
MADDTQGKFNVGQRAAVKAAFKLGAVTGGDRMAVRTCEICGGTFVQNGGRPAKRCPAHRRYGAAHRAARQAGLAAAYGTACCRCGRPLQPGQAIHLDHADDGQGYRGWSHEHCNTSAGAAKSNRARAAAYRALVNGQPPKARRVPQRQLVAPDPHRPARRRTRRSGTARTVGAAGRCSTRARASSGRRAAGDRPRRSGAVSKSQNRAAACRMHGPVGYPAPHRATGPG